MTLQPPAKPGPDGLEDSSAASVDHELAAEVDQILSRHPAVGLAVGVVRDGRLEFFGGHGVADIASSTPIGPDTVFRIASVTKTFTAIAVMQLYERGVVDLDAPVNDYLRSYRLVPTNTRWRPATVRHLMTHTAGLAELARPWGLVSADFGESYRAGKSLPSLAAFYGGTLPVHAEPGTRFVYNNHGPSTLGQLVEDVTGMSLDHYFRQHIFEPLGMDGTDLVRSKKIRSRLATGYEVRSRGVKRVADRDMVTAGAASVFSSSGDMARYLGALLGGGSNEHGSILKPDTLALMFVAHYQPDDRVPGMGLGFFRKDLSGQLVVRHQGTLPGFHSEVAVAPERGVGVMMFTNGAYQADFWLPAEAAGMLRRLLGIPDDAVRSDVPHHPELWGELSGWYRLSARFSDVRLRAMLGAGAEVFVRGGRLMLRFLTPLPEIAAGFPLRPDDKRDPYVFRIDFSDSGLEPIRIVFSQDPAGATTQVHLDVMPLVLDKQPAITNPRRWAAGTAGAVGAAGVAAAWGRRATGRTARFLRRKR
jgi:CubicO group peptidase (beta-lactamase class C family)